jgi:integrase
MARGRPKRAPSEGALKREEVNGRMVWRLHYVDHAGTRKRVVVGDTRDPAAARAREIIAQRNAILAGTSSPDCLVALGDLEGPYLADLTRQGRSPAHRKRTREALAAVLGVVGRDRVVSELTAADVAGYIDARAGDGLSNRTLNIHVHAGLRAMLRWARRTGRITLDPLPSGRVPKLPERETTLRKRRRALTDDEVARLVHAAQAADRPGVPEWPIWALLVEYGCRWGETSCLRWQDVEPDGEGGHLVRFRASTTKGKRSRCIPLPHSVTDALGALRKAQAGVLGRVPGPGDALFLRSTGTPWRALAAGAGTGRLRVLLKKAGIPRLTPLGEVDVHALRGTAATRLLQRGLSETIIAKLLGIEDVRVLLRHYLRVSDDDVMKAVRDLRTRELSGTGVATASDTQAGEAS